MELSFGAYWRITDGFFYTYGPTDFPLESGHKYAFQVTVSGDKIAFKNKGKSEVCSFTYEGPEFEHRQVKTQEVIDRFLYNENIYPSDDVKELLKNLNPETKSSDSIRIDYPLKFLDLPPMTSEKEKLQKTAFKKASEFNDSTQASFKKNLEEYFNSVDEFMKQNSNNDVKASEKMNILSKNLNSLLLTGKKMLKSNTKLSSLQTDYLNEELTFLNIRLKGMDSTTKNNSDSTIQNSIDLADDLTGLFNHFLSPEKAPGSTSNSTDYNNHGPYENDIFDFSILDLSFDHSNLTGKNDPTLYLLNTMIYPYNYVYGKPTAEDDSIQGLSVRVVPFLLRYDKQATNFALANQFTSPVPVALSLGKWFVSFTDPRDNREVKILGDEEHQKIDLETMLHDLRIKVNQPLKLFFPITR